MIQADLIDKLQLYPLLIFGLPILIGIGLYFLKQEAYIEVECQDRDRVVKLRYPEDLYIEEKYFKNIFFGNNLMFRTGLGFPVILGTFEKKEDAIQVKNEIFNLLQKGYTKYSVPEDVLDLEEILQEG